MGMFHRLSKPLVSKSFFLFGARGTGKSHLMRQLFPQDKHLWLDLTKPDIEGLLLTEPARLGEMIKARKSPPEWVIIDEVQKAPKLLDQVHYEIESSKVKFALTGSSARKLKRGGANLLAGRAFVNHLYPLTHKELGNRFDLQEVLSWGALPEIFNLESNIEKEEYLKSYVDVYLKEEVLQEQLVRDSVPFRKFLPIAAQMNGKLLNLKRIANDLGVDWTTVRSYFEILEDTWIGFQIPAYDKSLRKQQLKSNRFYLFDIGVTRALEQNLKVRPTTGQQIGPLFEHFIIAEIFRLNDYLRYDYKLFYIATEGGLEVDLVIDRPGKRSVLVEIKSTSKVQKNHLKHLMALQSDFPEFEAILLCNEQYPRKVDQIRILPWQDGLRELGF